ncbi:MAG: LPS-assembly protein LptD, partial [Bacteroidetes bacterium]|nr:LPS-assembly protein LptD [Bacteroidota bacterium]
LEMKYRSKKDTGDQRTKIKLIDGYGFSFSYNLLADSFALSQSIPFYVRSTLFQKINITAGANLNPYKQDKYGFTTKQYAWQGGKFSLGKITSGNISISTSFQSKPKDEAKEKARQKEINDRLNDPTAQADQNRLMDYMRQNPSEFVNFNIPWSLSLGLSVYFTETVKPDYSGFEKQFTSSANFSGTFNLTPKWNFSTSGMFNIKEKKIQPLQLSVSRDMHCWQMSISVVPTAPYRSFGFTISPKASILQDLKINRNRTFSGY